MKNTQKYFSLVTDRMAKLQEELNVAQKRKDNAKSIKSAQRYQLEMDFIARKIEHLKRLKDLPTLLLISNLTEEQVEELRRERKIPEGEDASYLIRSLRLEGLEKYIKQPKVVTMYHIKDAFVQDFDALNDLLTMHQQNMALTNHIDRLWGVGLGKEISYLRLTHDERKLKLDTANTDKLVAQAEKDFNLEDLKEISALLWKRSKNLPDDFIEKHRDKVLSENPDMAKTIKRLSRKKWLKWIDKLLPNRRKKDESAFMNTIVSYYNNSSVVADLGLDSTDLFNWPDKAIEGFTEQIQKICRIRKNQISARRNHINISKKVITNQIWDLQKTQEKIKGQFVDLIRTKTNFLPESFQDQIWKETDLKESCMYEACYLEEKALIAELTNLLQDQNSTSLENPTREIREVPKTKQLVA